MGKRIKKLLALLLVVSLCAAYVSIPVQASGLESLKAVGATVEVDGTNSTTVTVSLSASDAVTLNGIQGEWSTSEEGETNYLKMTEIGSDVLTFTGLNDADPDSGYVIWGDDTFSNPAVFDAEGKVLTATYEVAAGTPAGEYTVSFTAEYIMDGDFNEVSEVKYTATITVVDPNAPVIKEATIIFDDKAKRTEYSTSVQVWQENGITVTNEKGSSTSNVGDYAKPARFYKNSTLTIAYPGMTKIEVACNTTSYATALKNSITDGTVTVDGKVVTIVLSAAADTYSAVLSSAQVRVDSMTVYYVENSGSGETPECTHENVTHVEAKDATCQAEGNLEYWYCGDCFKYFADENCTTETSLADVTINKADHDYSGEDSRICTVCGQYQPNSALSIPEANELGMVTGGGYTTDKFYVTGVVIAIENEIYGNTTIQDADGNTLYIYGTYDADGSNKYGSMATKHQVGDTITVYGILGTYNDAPQMKYGWVTKIVAPECYHNNVSFVDATEATCSKRATIAHYYCADCDRNYADEDCTELLTSIETGELGEHDFNNPVDARKCVVCGIYKDGSTLTIDEVLEYGATLTAGATTEYKYNVVGTITSVTNTQYGNMNITDDEVNSLLIYGLYKDGVRYDAMETKPVAGDTIKVYGAIKYYNGTTIEIVDAELIEHTPAHVCSESNRTPVPGQAADCANAGWKDYYICSCGKLYDDAGNEITNLEAWKAEGGDGYIPATGNHNYVPGDYTWNEDNTTCTVIGTCDCGNTVTATATVTSEVTTVGTCQTAEVVTYTATFAELWAVDQTKSVTGEKNPANHTGTAVTYTNNGDGTHSATYDCCDAAYVTNEEHTYDSNTHKCACGDVEKFILTIDTIDTTSTSLPVSRTVTLEVPYGKNVMDVLKKAIEDGKITAPNTLFRQKTPYFDGYATTTQYYLNYDVMNELDDQYTMPANNITVSQGNTVYTGWGYYYTGDQLDGAEYILKGEWLQAGWYFIEEDFDDVEGGAWYCFVPGTGDYADYCNFRVEGTARVPYPTVAINGVTYGANTEDKAYWEAHKDTSKYTDAESALFIFDENGKFQQTTGIVDGNRYAVNGMIGWHVGLVEVDGEYYYFGGDANGNGNIMLTGKVYVTRNTTDLETVKGGIYTFGEDGKLCKYDGITEIDGKLYYYDHYRLAIDAGLVKVDGGYYYVRSSGDKVGQLVVGRDYWVANTNGLLAAGMYTFGADGKIVMGAESEELDGIVNVDGTLYYYKGGVKQVGAGVVELTDENGETFYIYVRSNGQLATGVYWPTTLNGYLERGAYDWGTDGRYYPAED